MWISNTWIIPAVITKASGVISRKISTCNTNLHTSFTKNIAIIARLNNIWDKKYESNGYTYSYFYDHSLVKENFYFPMAGRNFMLALNVKF